LSETGGAGVSQAVPVPVPVPVPLPSIRSGVEEVVVVVSVAVPFRASAAIRSGVEEVVVVVSVAVPFRASAANMRHVRQQNEIDCGLAAAAMLSDRDYEDADANDPNPYSPVGFTLDEMLQLLAALNKPARASRMQYGKPLSEATLPGVCAIIIQQPGKQWGHWIVLDGDQVGDPEYPTYVSLSEYRRRSWRVIRVVVLRPD